MELWHYTSIDTFIKIVESKKIRATHISYLNDLEELAIGFKYIIDKYPKIYNTHKDFCNKILKNTKEQEIYLTCFSQAEDSLYQWHAYTPKENGIAIKFKIDYLKEHNEQSKNFTHKDQKNTYYPLFKECRYLEKDKAGKFNKTFRIPSVLKDKLKSQDQDFMLLIDELFGQSELKKVAITLKHAAFEFEKEYRLICFPEDAKRHFCYNTHKKYIDLDFEPQRDITGLMISPMGDKKRNEQFITDYVKYHPELFQEGLLVELSDIPFRG